jgi:hypothetical protein
MFAPNSRYAGQTTYTVTMPDGSVVVATRLPLPRPLALAGYHRRVTGDRLDLLAARYLKDPTFFWRICDSNNAPVPDALNARDLIGIPRGPATA